ncbi:hypothetical protein M422DRAFT_217939 [Sphaerobolus stellatus SS14]|nr:hypothetical protein M422DRAFT_217939 [Sphaerobolus stellatus SS14]
MNADNDCLAPFINKCKSASDIDSKVDAVTKLQEEFQNGTTIADPEGLIAALNACLRTSNQHLTTATISALIPLFPLLATSGYSELSELSSSNSALNTNETAILRLAVNAFLPPGGIFERLGDTREKARERAKEALIAIGSATFKSSGAVSTTTLRGKDSKVPETPLQFYERYLREQGLQSKSWRVREQSLLILVQLRQTHASFPLRSFLPALVDTLEDSDGTVRDCSKQSIVGIFSSPGVTDAARADLKKEMTKKNVRKTIVDGILSKLLGTVIISIPSVDVPDGKDGLDGPTRGGALRKPLVGRSASQLKGSEPERPASRAGEQDSGTEISPVYIASARDLESEFSRMLPAFEGRETEHNWLERDEAVKKIRGMLRGDVFVRYPEPFLAGLKNGVLEATLKALASLRTTLSTGACSLYEELAVSLGTALDPWAEMLIAHLLRMAGFTKKLIATQSQVVVDIISQKTSCHPRQYLSALWAYMNEKNVQTRAFTVGHFKVFVDYHGTKSRQVIESAGGLDLLEKAVRKGLADPNPTVREKARAFFWSFESVWKDKALAILNGLEATARKQLQNVSPVPLEDLGLPKPSPPATKKSSIAAAIAASRAKAKQIANAPPTLRHQATSTSHAQHTQATRVMSPPVSARRASSPTINTSPRAASPSSPPRTTSNRSSANRSSLVGHERQRMSSASPSPPPSPTVAMHRRRVSSSYVAPSIDNVVSQYNSVVIHSPGLSSPSHTSNPRTHSVLRTPQRALSPKLKPLDNLLNDPEESMVMATQIPLPADSEFGDDDSVNLINFSAPWETPKPAESRSAASSSPTPSTSRLNSVPHSVVEDALRARAAQAESAAEQLLELVNPDDGNHISPIPPSLLRTNGTTPKPPTRLAVPPVTPINQTSAIMRQAALFQDSPVYKAGSPSILDIIEERKHQTGWWLKRMSIINQGKHSMTDFSARLRELEECTQALEKEVADLGTLRTLILLCYQNPAQSVSSPPGSPTVKRTNYSTVPTSPSPRGMQDEPVMLGDIWDAGKRSGTLFKALCAFLRPDKERTLLEHGLFVLWELLSHLDGHDSDVLALLLRLRYAQDFNVDEGTLTIRDAQVELMNERNFTLYGLSTMNGCLKEFLSQPIPPHASQDAKIRAYAFGLITMAKFIIKLPPDILEEELPKIKQTLVEAYLNAEAMVRQAATTAITAAQVILQDETHLFALLEPLPDDKKNLLTYFFEKSNARGGSIGQSSSGMEKLSKEMDRLDQRLSTPPRARR